MSSDLEERVRKLETRTSLAKGGAVALVIANLVLFGIVNWHSIPRAVEAKMAEIIGDDVLRRIRIADQEAKRRLASSFADEDKSTLNAWATDSLVRDICHALPGGVFDPTNRECLVRGGSLLLRPPFPDLPSGSSEQP